MAVHADALSLTRATRPLTECWRGLRMFLILLSRVHVMRVKFHVDVVDVFPDLSDVFVWTSETALLVV